LTIALTQLYFNYYLNGEKTVAYMNQERKATIAKQLKPVLAKYGVKGSLAVHNHSTIELTLKSGLLDFIGDRIEEPNAPLRNGREALRAEYALQVNPYWYHEHFTGKSKQFLTEVFDALRAANWYDNSDARSDYFDTAYYINVNVGKRWPHIPYILTK